MKTTLLWLGTFLVHVVAQFVAWSLADSPSAGPAAAPTARILMFPAFDLTGNLGNHWFWSVFLINSGVWATVAVLAARRLWWRRPVTDQHP